MLRSTSSLPTPGKTPARASGIRGGLFTAMVSLALLGLAHPAMGQAKRCDLVSKDTVVSGVSIKKCLDLDALNGTSMTVPSNVTRIDNDGLSLCRSSARIGGDADIAFVLDQSGSMAVNRAWVSADGKDTLYYFNDDGCSNDSTSGTVVIPQHSTAGYTVPRLVSRTGCRSASGDPFGQRAIAVRKSMDYMDSVSDGSTAGYVGFASGITAQQSLLQLNSAANLTTLKNRVTIQNSGGTNYTVGLSRSKLWLNDPAMRKTTKQAIIFISDGQPTEPSTSTSNPLGPLSYLDTIKTNMPPVYTIYLGQGFDTSGYFRLRELAQKTGGTFNVIPPTRPDSLVAVVRNILNLILKDYAPENTTVTNGSLAPVQDATATMPAGFVAQPGGSWLVRLNDIVALRGGASNAITVSTNFKETTDGTIINRSISFTINTTGAATSGSGVITGSQFSRTCYDPSSLRILNAAGARPPALTEADVSHRLRLRTGAIDLTSMASQSATRSRGDAEAPSLARLSSTADSSVFQFSGPFSVASSGASGDGTLQSALFDTVVARWTHPRDLQDFATDTLAVRAANVSATAWFSLTEGGVQTTTYQADQKKVFVVINDQAADPRLTYTAMVTSDRFGADSETVTLRVLSPGVLVGELTVSNLAKTRQDGLLQVSVGGDQLKVEYRDPTYGDVAVNTAGFDENVQEAPRLEFTDEGGVPLPPGTVWPPTKGKIYLKYSDDYAYGRVPDKQISLTLASLRYGIAIGSDHERITLNMASGSSGSRATWSGALDLADIFPPSDSNGKAEARYRGEAVVTAFSHDNTGTQQATLSSDSLLIAYPDSVAVITWTLGDTSKVPKGSEGLVITVKDQDFSVATNDSIGVTISCIKSNDSVSSFIARETSGGTYLSGILVKDEGIPNPSDRILSCLSADQIRIRYIDPVFGTSTELIINEVALPVADPKGRNFITVENVTLSSATPGAIIYYTTDGTTPVPGVGRIYTGPIPIVGTTVLKAIAVLPGWKDSKVMVETYTKNKVASRLDILDENGNEVTSGFVTGSAKGLRIKVTTTQANLGSAQADLSTRLAADREFLLMANSAFLGSAFEYWGNVPLSHGKSAGLNNDTVEATGIDTLVAVWRNPFDSTDVAMDTLIIKPAFQAAEVYFALTEGGPRITTYPDSQKTIFIVVKTRPKDPTQTYQVTVTSKEFGTDTEVLNLTELSPGVFSAQVPVVRGDKSPNVPGVLQVSATVDQLTAVFVDPIYKDSYRGDAGFGQDVQESAVLDFVTKDSVIVAPDQIWSPAEGKVYLRYSDDWHAGIDSLVHTRTARLTLVNKKSGNVVTTDEENVVLTLVSNTATRGTWIGSIELRDRSATGLRNDTLETYFRGELLAVITPHNNKGLPASPDVSDQLVIAYPNTPAEILIRDNTDSGAVDRTTDKVSILVRDQQFTKTDGAFITVNVACDATGDKVLSVKLYWNGEAYVAIPPITKVEGTGADAKSDSILTCKSSDRITVTYPDPVFGEIKVADVRWSDEKAAKIFFASTRDSSVITSVADGVDKDFLIYIEGLSPTRDKADTIDVVLTTGQGEKLTVKAVETGVLTGIFRVQVPFYFITSDPDPKNDKLEANINRDQRNNRVIVTAEATIDGTKLKGELALFSAYNMVVKAYIKDVNGDGRADMAYFVFDKKLARLPASLEEVAWNEEDAKFRQKAGTSMLSFLNSDSNVVVADFTKSPFGVNLTGIPEGKKPYALFPADNLFGGQLALLADSVGAIAISAVKHPSNLNSYSVSATEKRFYPDTLVIQVSEPLKTSTNWSEMIRFSKGCADIKESVPLKLFKEPEQSTSNPLEWILIVDNSPQAQIPLVGDCVFLEIDGRYTDLVGNRPGTTGAPITGDNPKLVIRDFRGFPPVAGLDPGSPGFVLVTNDIKKENNEGRWSSQTGNGSYQVIWIPPVGLDECNNSSDLMKCLEGKVPSGYDAKATPKRDIENQSFAHMPVKSLSAIQVIATGRYIARVNIYDNFGVHVRTFVQAFGYWGEEKNPWRATDKGLRSFLVWDLKDKGGQLAGQGVYVWKVNFSFSDKKSEVMYTRTGVMRNN